MRKHVINTILAVSLAVTAVPAMAAKDSGVPAYDRMTRTLFVNGHQYYVPSSLNTIRLRGAERVTVDWEQQGDRKVVTRFSAERPN